MAKIAVAPLVGAWIEIQVGTCVAIVVIVAPLVGAWIEIPKECLQDHLCTSLPSWERGLKSAGGAWLLCDYASLPSWERGLKCNTLALSVTIFRRSPRGSVD